MSSIVKEVQALINTLGFLENDKYYPEPDYFQNVRDLIRYLHRDDRLFTIRRLCNERNIVKNDLVPMIGSKDCSDDIFDVALRITVNLCQPTFMLYNNKRPDGPAEWQLFYELETSLVRTLTAFTDERIFQIFAVKIDEYFDKDWEDRTENQRLIIERIFVLIRYLFSIGVESIGPNSVPEIDHSIRARIITNFFLSDIPEIFFKLSSITTEKEFCFYIVIILALVFKTLDPLTIAHEGNAELQKGDKEKLEKEQTKAIEIYKAEEEEKRRKINRRSFLAGSFVVKDLKPLNAEKDFVVNGSLLEGKENNPIANIEALSKRKKTIIRPKSRRVDNLEMYEVCTTEDLCSLKPETMLTIKQFCSRFILEGKYNRLIRTTKDMAFNGAKRGTSSVSEFHLFTLSSFMLAFTRYSHYSCQHITSTFSVEFFHQITSFLTDCFDKMKLDKQNIKNWALSAQYAVTAFKEVTIMLNFISNSIFEEDKEFFRDFCHQIFQVEEYRELATGILRHLFPAGTSHKMLQDLIIANHYFLHLMEKSVKLGELLKFQRKKRKNKQKKTQKRKHKEQKKLLEKTMKLCELDELWQEINEELSDVLDGKIKPNEDANPLNVLIRTEEEQLQEFAKLQIQLTLRTRQISDAVGIYRNARVLWPEMGIFGYDHFTNEEEKLALSEIFHADMKSVSKDYIEAMKKAYGKNEEEEEANSNFGDLDGDANDEMKNGSMDEFLLNDDEADLNGTKEANFDFPRFVLSMAKPNVIDWYIFSFRQFRTNPMEVNLAIIKFFHRIAFDLKSPARLYLAKLFVVLKDIKNEICRGTNGKRNRHNHPYFKLYEFGYYLLMRFFTNYEERGGGIIACELLFAKTAKEAYELEYGYGSLD